MSSRKEHFASSPRAGALVDAILVLLDFACVWTPLIGSVTADPPASVGLVFELLRAEKAVFDIGTWATSLGRESGAMKPVSATDECQRTLRTVVAHFSDPIAKLRATLGEGGQLEPEFAKKLENAANSIREVLATIRQNEESLELEDSPALEDVRCVGRPTKSR